jgi:hypothetical protein
MYRLITKVTGRYGVAKVIQDKAIPVEAGQWAVTTGGPIPSRWDGYSRQEAMVEAYRVSGAEPMVPGLGCSSWGPAIGEYAIAKSKEAA